jgi:hypothetical protein
MVGRGDRVSACIVKYHTVPRPLLPSIRFQPWARLFFRQQSVRKCPRMSETRSASQQLNAILLCDPEERRNYGRSHDSTVSRTGTFGVVVATLGVLLKSSCSHQLLVCPTAECVRKNVHTCSSGYATARIRTQHCRAILHYSMLSVFNASLFWKWSMSGGSSHQHKSFLYKLQVTQRLQCSHQEECIYAFLGFV